MPVAEGDRQTATWPDATSERLDCLRPVIQVHEQPVGAHDVEDPTPHDLVQLLNAPLDELGLDACGSGVGQESGQQGRRGVKPSNATSSPRQPQRLGPLAAAHIEDRCAVSHMRSELPGDQLLTNDIAQVAEPVDPTALSLPEVAHRARIAPAAAGCALAASAGQWHLAPASP